MKTPGDKRQPDPPPGLTSELLILPDGSVLVHNLTPVFAELLARLNPACRQIASRTPNPESPIGCHELPD